MFCLSESDTFYLYPYPTDMRKSFYSLSGIVANEMRRDVRDGEAFIFINRSLTSLKILHAEYSGLVIYNLKLEKGCFSLPDMRFDDDNAPPYRLNQWQELAYPIIRALEAWALNEKDTVMPKSPIGKALGYLLGHIQQLSRYITDGRYQIDNNFIENSVRPLAVGRKNYLF